MHVTIRFMYCRSLTTTLLQRRVGNSRMASGGGGGTVGNATSTYAGGTGGIGITADANGGVSLVKALLSRTVQCMSCHVLLSSCMQACHDGITRCMVCRMVGMVAVAVVATH